ncbi:hypothetical protein [Lacipirellula parvula]|uniref:hypothetical protein n=1 Tax=Lacipirellula parvula TaxID=2650471 RepID=UPI00126074C9|nr:hypothetical protein [Lacipirellula parvula]
MKPPRPWWSHKSGQERQRLKAEDGKRRGFDDDANRHLVKLCAKFGLRYDSRVKASMDGGKLTLAHGKLSFALSLENYSEFYLRTVCEILLRDAHPTPNALAPRLPTAS